MVSSLFERGAMDGNEILKAEIRNGRKGPLTTGRSGKSWNAEKLKAEIGRRRTDRGKC
jgi:hypothetical protein